MELTDLPVYAWNGIRRSTAEDSLWKKNSASKVTFRVRDVIEIALGACIMAFPTATTEEVWNLGAELSLSRAVLFLIASIFFLAVLIYGIHGHKSGDRKVFVQRVIATYLVTFLIGAALLSGVDRLELFTDPLTGLKRAILVAFPASFAATAVDSFGSSGSTTS
jgi:uncharacterized membrane protein